MGGAGGQAHWLTICKTFCFLEEIAAFFRLGGNKQQQQEQNGHFVQKNNKISKAI